MARLGAVVAAFVVAFIAISAPAETLQRLTVTQLVLGADTARPKLEVPFHLLVRAHVRERVQSLDNLDLPVLADVELLGDEHSLVTSASGTDYREVITVVAHHTGTITIDPVTLDAIDARNGKPTRFSSNQLMLVVGGGSLEPTADLGDVFGRIVRFVVLLVGIVALAILIVLFARRPRRATPAPVAVTLPPAIPVAPPVRSQRQILGDALTLLQAERTRAAAMRVRHVVRSLVGASDTETLTDVLRRPAAREPGMSEVLQTLERAAFTYESDLPHAIVRAVTALQEMLR